MEPLAYKELIIKTVTEEVFRHFGGDLTLHEKVLVTSVAGYTFMYPLANVTQIRIE